MNTVEKVARAIKQAQTDYYLPEELRETEIKDANEFSAMARAAIAATLDLSDEDIVAMARAYQKRVTCSPLITTPHPAIVTGLRSAIAALREGE